MTYPQIIRYLESLINYERLSSYPYKEFLKLDRIRDFLFAIGNPQDALKCIHVAGTKGKGSTVAFITYILREAGYKVGLYTSPHLSDFRERIRILNPKSEIRPAQLVKYSGIPQLAGNPKLEFEGMISKGNLARMVKKLKPGIEKYNKNSRYGPLSFFEVYTALAFVYFKEKKVDFAVLETGLGGRLDATNTVKPLVCAIAPISYEHTQKLGNTLREIASEKAGIIKRAIVISAPQKKEAIDVIRKKCNQVHAKFYEVSKGITYKVKGQGLKHPALRLCLSEGKVYRPCGNRRVSRPLWEVKGIFNDYKGLKLRLLGEHQVINAATAIGAVEALRFYGINIGIDAIKNGLYNTLWPGRCEVAVKKPFIVLDGAQNIASAKALKEAVKNNFQYKKLILVLGISNDKDLKGICDELRPLADEVVLTRANNPRATKPQVLAQYFKGKPVYITQSVKEAKDSAKRLAKKEDLVLVTGSLFVVGDFRDAKS